MNPTFRLLTLAAIGGLSLSSCVSYDPYSPYGYAAAPIPVRASGYYDSGYAGYPRYSGYDYGYGYGYGGYPVYSSLSLGFFGRSGGYYDGYPYYSSGRYGHSHHDYSHHDRNYSSSRTRTFRGAPLSASAPPTPNFSAPRQLSRSSSVRSSSVPQLVRPSAPSSRFSSPGRSSAPAQRAAPMPSPSRRTTREPTTAARPASSGMAAAAFASDRRRTR